MRTHCVNLLALSASAIAQVIILCVENFLLAAGSRIHADIYKADYTSAHILDLYEILKSFIPREVDSKAHIVTTKTAGAFTVHHGQGSDWIPLRSSKSAAGNIQPRTTK